MDMELDRNQNIRLYVNRLVTSLVPREFGNEYIQSVSSDLNTYLLEGLHKNNQYDIQQLLNGAKRRFASRGMTEEWIKFENVLETLSNKKSLDQIANYLVFFTSLLNKETSQTETQTQPQARIPSTLQSSPYNRNIRLSSAIDHNNFSQPLDTLIGPYYETLPETEILTYLPYSLLGLDSKLLSFDKIDIDHYIIKLPDTINNSYNYLLSNILEAGLLYKWIKHSVDSKRGSILSPIKNSLLRCLEEELNHYVNFINEIFNDKENSDSLIKIYKLVFDKIFILRFFYKLLKQFDNINGYDLLLMINQFSKFGDLRIKNIATAIFSQISIPYYEIIEHWIIKGELIDNNEEFFIKFNVEENHINDIIEFIPAKIPDFFTSVNKSIGYKIFQIGKLLIFLNKYCNELTWINNYKIKYSNYVFNVNDGLKSMNMNLINELINQQYTESLKFFTKIIFEKNSMIEHLNNFKNFYLMKNNDFIDSIIKQGLTLFSQPSNSLTSNQLSTILIESINTSTIRYFPQEYVQRLDARILDLSHGNIGWEVFTLEYKINDLPIENILNHNQGLLEYLKMFNFLWKLRHLQYLLNEDFIEYNYLLKNDLRAINQKYVKLSKRRDGELSLRDKKILWIIKSYKVINVIRNQLVKFITTLISYFSFDLIENNYQNLIINKLYKCSNQGSIIGRLDPEVLKSFQSRNLIGLNESETESVMNELTIDELIEVHATYIKSITNCKLFNDSSIGKISGNSYIKLIYTLLEIVFLFIKSSEEFSSLMTNYITIVNMEENDDSDDQYDDDLEAVDDKLRIMVSKIYHQIYLDQFHATKQQFIKDLRNDLTLKDLGKCL